MRIAYFDCFAGISGDMAVGALLDAGVPLSVVQDGLAKLGLPVESLQVAARTIVRSQIHATKFDVVIDGAHAGAHVADGAHPENGNHGRRDHDDEHRGGVHHTHSHADEGHGHHEHGHTHEGHGHHSHEHHHEHHEHGAHGHEHHEHEHGEHHHRSHAEIVAMIDRSGLAAGVKERARKIFGAIAVAEARIHGVEVEAVHFHEVGAIDSIADIVAVALCLDHLGIEEVYSSAVPLGSGGTIRTQHGIMPLPAPATLEILKGYPTTLSTLPYELTTPTGAGILKSLSRGVLTSEVMQAHRIGFGAGTRELPDRPNLLRVVVGEMLLEEEHDQVTVIEANIDDLNPQIYPFLLERLLEAGALDAYLTPVIMKKGRPGMLLTVLAEAGGVDDLTSVIYRETTTIGVRYREQRRRKLPRRELTVPTEFGPVQMKKIEGEEGMRLAPEFEEARRIARERALPLKTVMERLAEAAKAYLA